MMYCLLELPNIKRTPKYGSFHYKMKFGEIKIQTAYSCISCRDMLLLQSRAIFLKK